MSLPRILLFLAAALTPLATLGAADALVFTANGEEHAREGTQSRDGWAITFQHVYVALDAVTAYQTNPPYDTSQGWSFTHQEKVRLPGTHTVDLADAAADPAPVGQVTPRFHPATTMLCPGRCRPPPTVPPKGPRCSWRDRA
ncbi:MAG: hypothetical protein U5O69_08085 [Candidatus Competibacteraceae bacterium]|nr:hypothetical protein [Candidatus Competibacteraceae bacterium]